MLRNSRTPTAAATLERECFESGHTVDEVTGSHSLRLKTLDRQPCTVIAGQINLLLQFMGHKKGAQTDPRVRARALASSSLEPRASRRI